MLIILIEVDMIGYHTQCDTKANHILPEDTEVPNINRYLVHSIIGELTLWKIQHLVNSPINNLILFYID